QRCQRLHFLHAANIPAWPDRGGTRIGTYTVRYADGTHDAIPIVLGKTIGLFMRNSGWADKGGEGGDAKVAVWLDTETTLVDGKSTRLLQLSWDNPHPGRAITSIDAEWWNDSDITGHIVLV